MSGHLPKSRPGSELTDSVQLASITSWPGQVITNLNDLLYNLKEFNGHPFLFKYENLTIEFESQAMSS